RGSAVAVAATDLFLDSPLQGRPVIGHGPATERPDATESERAGADDRWAPVRVDSRWRGTARGAIQRAPVGEGEGGLQPAIVPARSLGLDPHARKTESTVLFKQPDGHAFAHFGFGWLRRKDEILVGS